MPTARLDDRAVLAVTGRDAKAFLQGLISNDIEKAAPSLYAALLTPQGKVLFDFLLYAEGDGYLLDASAAQADDLLKRLKMYKLRSAVDLALRPDLCVFASWGDDGEADKPADPRLPSLGSRWITSSTASQTAAVSAYQAHRLQLGVPDSADISGEFLLDANGEELHAVDFRKGCFVGQEVTARMKHKAKPRRRMVPVSIDGERPQAGTPLTGSDGAEAGEIATGYGERAIASVRVDRVAVGDVLNANGASLLVRPAGYALPIPAGR